MSEEELSPYITVTDSTNLERLTAIAVQLMAHKVEYKLRFPEPSDGGYSCAVFDVKKKDEQIANSCMNNLITVEFGKIKITQLVGTEVITTDISETESKTKSRFEMI